MIYFLITLFLFPLSLTLLLRESFSCFLGISFQSISSSNYWAKRIWIFEFTIRPVESLDQFRGRTLHFTMV